jgi:hypothetical protein
MSRGTADAAFSRMKPVLLLVFLGLGPALADQVPVLPQCFAPASTERAAHPDALAQRTEALPASPLADDWAGLCPR